MLSPTAEVGQEQTATIFRESARGAFSDETVVGLRPEKRTQIAQHILGN